MTRLVLFLLRTIALALSFALSSFVAAGFITFVLFLGSDLAWLENDPTVAAGAAAFLVAMWLTITQLALFPALIGLVFLEFTRQDSILINMLAGGFCALTAMLLAGLDNPSISETSGLPYGIREIWIAVLAAGFVAGLTHWALAGHRAGRWMGPQRELSDSDHEN